MKKIRQKLLIVLIFSCFGFYAISLFANDEHEEKPGDHAKVEKQMNEADSQRELVITNDYTHSWLPFPKLSGKSVFVDETLEFGPQKGYGLVLIFISSWCLPCQKLMPEIRQMEERFSKLNTKFFYVFSNDTATDARGFSKEHGIKVNAVIANHEILKTFHNPELPTIYIGDRHGWLLTRKLKPKEDDLKSLASLLDRMNAY